MSYTREDACRAWLTYGQMNADVMAELLSEYDSAEAIFDRLHNEGSSFLREKLPASAVAQLHEHANYDAMHEMLVTMQKLNIHIMTMEDPKYPDLLRHIPSPPPLLFYQGNPDCLLGRCLTVVGSRKASPKGVEATKQICRELSNAGVTIVSGLAMGIDRAAHEGCLEGGSPTVAVLACGMDVDYPAENLDLKKRILREGGLLLSEYPLGMRPNKYLFQARNRIMSGLSKATVMMESRIRSGSMITVNHALNQGREVYAYPGLSGTEWAEGAHQLLREGAHYFASAQDIIDDLGWSENRVPQLSFQQKQDLPPMTEDQRNIYTLLGRGELSFDQLAAETGLGAAELSTALMMMQMMGIIKPMPGKTYQRH